MADTGIMIDTREFDAALRQYAAVSSKDYADVCNHQLRNLAIQSLKRTKKAQRSAIRALKQAVWWPKYISKIIAKRGAYLASSKTRRKSAGRNTRYTRMARKISAQILRQRTKAVSFLRGFFWKMQQSLAPAAQGERPPAKPPAVFRDTRVTALPATARNLRSSVSARYNYKKRSQKTASGAERILFRVLRMAYPATARDMKVYIERKTKKTAERFSGRRTA